MEIKKENFFVIKGFMLSELNLKGNELLVYAIIYGFSQIENQYFTGSINYLSSWTGISSRTTVFKVLNSLIEKGLIIKEEEYKNNIKFCKYKAVIKNQNQIIDIENTLGNTENELGVVQNMYEGSTEIEPNNIDIIYKDNIDNLKKNIKKKSTFASQKHLRFPKKINFQETLRKNYEEENNNFKLENFNNIVAYINSLNIQEDYKNKLLEFYEYRKIINSPICSKKIIDSILAQDFENEEHAKLCIDFAMGNEYIRVLPEYVKYKKNKKEDEKLKSGFIEVDFSKSVEKENEIYPWD